MRKRITRIPGLVDVHVHMREPGDVHKEDWSTGSAAALAGGITTILAMPNTKPAIVDLPSFELASALAQKGSRCDYGLFVGGGVDNAESLAQLAAPSAALKMYLNATFGQLKLDEVSSWRSHFLHWPRGRPICVHAEGTTLSAVLFLALAYKRHLHVCHVSSRTEIELIAEAKRLGGNITCEVCPHHLYFSLQELKKRMPNCGRCDVRPRLQTDDDVKALWEHLGDIDIFASDHAPHTPAEKDGKTFVPGFPGIEYMLPLLLNCVHKGLLTLDDVITRMYTNPAKIFNLPLDPIDQTYVEVDLDETWVIPSDGGYSKAHWTPYAGVEVTGKVLRTVMRGKEVFSLEKGVTGPEGEGQDVRKRNPRSSKL
eukprot:PhF_6_TR13871/c0_g1_i1/m.22262/K11540/CAD; carbamoyl-phosphate synthase / aspartate carbamoyltransferase / dihydroorotase